MPTSEKKGVPAKAVHRITGSTIDPDVTQANASVLSYNPSRLRIQVTLSTADCLATATPPPALIAKARAKMQAVTAAGRIAFFVVYERRLAKLWQTLRQEGAPPKSVTMTLAAGAPRLRGLSVKVTSPSSDAGAVAMLSIDATSAEVTTWRIEWLLLHIGRELRKAGSKVKVNAIQVHGALCRARAGLRVEQLPLVAASTSQKSTEAFHLTINQKRGEVGLVIFAMSAIADADATQARLERIASAIARLKERDGHDGKGRYLILQEDLLEAFDRARSGPESLGYDLPLSLLAAVDVTKPAPVATPLPPSVDAPKAGSEPYLHILAGHHGASDDRAAVDMRAYRKKPLARRNELIAEIRWREPTSPSPTAADESPSKLEVATGEGIRATGDGRFFAEFDGILQTDEGGKLFLQRQLLHEGDVNMTSGDIRFDGPVEITGDVESGTNIHVGGDLTVRGDIRGGQIWCAGNLVVERAIIMGPIGEVRVRGNVTADFIENSKVSCGGDLTVKKSILQCQVRAGGSIQIDGASGVIGGGSLAAGKRLSVANLGLRDGAKTIVSVGSNYRAESTLVHRRSRHEALLAKQDNDRKLMRELVRKRPEQLSKSDKALKQKLQARIGRWVAVLEKSLAHLRAAEGALTYDPAASIAVTGYLAANCEVRIGGRVVPIGAEKVSVEITAEEKDGSYIHARSA